MLPLLILLKVASTVFLFTNISQISGQILEVQDLGKTFQSLGWYFTTVVVGILIHGAIVLPLIYSQFFLLTVVAVVNFVADKVNIVVVVDCSDVDVVKLLLNQLMLLLFVLYVNIVVVVVDSIDFADHVDIVIIIVDYVAIIGCYVNIVVVTVSFGDFAFVDFIVEYIA